MPRIDPGTKSSAKKASKSVLNTRKSAPGAGVSTRAKPNKPGSLNKKLLARVSGTTKGEVRGVVHGPAPRAGLKAMAKGGPTAGAAVGSRAQKRAAKEVKMYLKSTKKAPIKGKKRA